MKKICTLIASGLSALGSFAQEPPQGYGNGTVSPTVNNSSFSWFRGGNFQAGAAQNSNIFGTLWNSPIYTQTFGQTRMVVNGDRTTSINGFNNQITSGFIGIGANPAAQNFPFDSYNNNAGPFSLLHLNSGVGTFVQPFGWRPWMKYGITSTHNQDLAFFGQRQNPSSAPGGFDVTDVVIGWGDNPNSGTYGPDNMVFNFLAGTATDPQDDLTGSSLNGREIMRLTGFGNVGIGPRFNNSFQPQSTLHQHQENSQPSWMQITNQFSNGFPIAGAPTPITPFDGLKWGIDGSNTGYLYNQENNHLLFSTGMGVTGGDRMRITHIGAPGTPNPGSIVPGTTRVSISHNPLSPVTNPLSLLHIGYNTSGPGNDGWRSWMDVGMYVSQSSDNVFLGLKNESSTLLGDKYDAVLSWGDNQVNSNLPPNNGPDNFRFIFTSSTTGSAGGTFPAISPDGLEGMRLTPTPNAGVFTGVGGAPAVNPYSTGQNPGNTMEINSWGTATSPGGSSGLRFTDLNTTSLTVPNPGQGVLSVNSAGDVVYVQSTPSSSFGAACSAPVAASNLTADWRVGMNNFSVNFDGTGNVNIGDIQGCIAGSSSPSRLWVRNSFGLPNPTTGLRVDNNFSPGSFSAELFGDVFIGGNGISPGPGLIFSDINFKDNVADLPSSLDILAKLKPVSYNLNNTYAPQIHNDTSKTYGLIAQQVGQVIPELVKTVMIPAGINGAGEVTNPSVKAQALNYIGLIPFLIAGTNELNARQKETQAKTDEMTAQLLRSVQEQQLTIDSLKNAVKKQDSINSSLQQQIAELTAQIKNHFLQPKANSSDSPNQADVELSDKDIIVLNQNVPNPFAEQTTITYSIPESIKKAQLVFYNSAGQIVQAMDIKTRGRGKVNVFASDLSTGLYYYKLIADGKVADSKKMMRE